WKVFVDGNKATDSPSFKWAVLNGNHTNPAILWPEFFRCEGNYNIKQATNIAALTILMGGDINPRGVRGLEIWQYRSGWVSLADQELLGLTAKYEQLK